MSDLKSSEFECPIHGRFEALVPRAEDPDALPCPSAEVCHCCCRRPAVRRAVARQVTWVTLCAECLDKHHPVGDYNRGDYYPPDGEVIVPCGQFSPWRISAPGIKVLSRPCYAEVRGGDTERRPGMLDTRPLAEGQSLSEWKKAQIPAREERRYQQLKAKGLLTPRIQSK